MCGIAGFIGFRDDDLIKKISTELQHRGPDGEGFFINDDVTLLNRRLAIIDRKGGDQPIYNEDKTLVVVYNGEIYNYQELRKSLEKEGHKFSTHSDTEVIVHGYEQWGEECFDKFNGMFAIALYDIKNKKLILARDHFGIKPLYYSMIGNDSMDPATRFLPPVLSSLRAVGEPSTRVTHRIIFSSEIKPIINSGLIKKEPNDKIIYRYLMYRVHDDNEETFFKGIYKLMPGEMVTVDDNGINKKYFSNLESDLLDNRHSGERSDSRIDSGRARSSLARMTNGTVKEFKERLIDAIRMRLISEVPVGTCLSGGLDSSTVAVVVNKLLKEKAKEAESVGKNQNTFSAVFPDSSNNEEKYIDELLAKNRNIKSHKIYPKPEEFFMELEDFIKTQEEPTISTGPYAQYKVMQEAKKYVTVLLDGQGADEMMAGYLPYYFVYLKQLQKEGNYVKLISETLSSLDVVTKYFFRFKRNVSTKMLLNKNFINENSGEKFVTTNDNLKRRLVEDIFHNSLPSLLRYEDKNSMRFSIEGRVPFLDINLIKFIFSLDDSAIIKDGWNKNILREAVKDLLPENIVKRRNKIGFTTPENEWFMKMKNRIYSFFLTESFANRKYFNQPEVLKAFQKFIEGKNDDTMVFWRMMNLEMWFRLFIDKPSAKELTVKVKQRSIFSPNPGKELKIEVDLSRHPELASGSHLSFPRKRESLILDRVEDDKPLTFFRFPVKTDLFVKGDNVAKKIFKHIKGFFIQFDNKKQFAKLKNKEWFIVLSEKIIAISQGRSYFIWDIKPGFLAKTLSKFVKRTPFGIGLGSPWTMQLAIQEVGVVRVLVASVLGVLGRLMGFRGVFYIIAGGDVRAIDGPTEYSLYPSNVSAKLPPKNSPKVAKDIHQEILKNLPKEKAKLFQGVVIIDANDLGRNILGNSTKYKNELVEQIFADNPMGQSAEQTPLTIVFNANNS